jgi:rhamnogalacturonyl hydrolase YesR
MVPPFLAYYGVMTKNKSAVAESYNQIRLYRQYLRDQNASSLWKHMALGTNQDTGHWSTGLLQVVRLIIVKLCICTGNGWAAAGMIRVLGTIKNSQYASSFKNEQKDLINWVLEIHNGMYTYLVCPSEELRHGA